MKLKENLINALLKFSNKNVSTEPYTSSLFGTTLMGVHQDSPVEWKDGRFVQRKIVTKPNIPNMSYHSEMMDKALAGRLTIPEVLALPDEYVTRDTTYNKTILPPFLTAAPDIYLKNGGTLKRIQYARKA